MKKCACKIDYNISEADIQIRSPHDICIHINRAADNPTIASLRKRIEDLETFNLTIDSEIDRMLAERLQNLDLVTRAALAELLGSYTTEADLVLLQNNLLAVIAQEREHNDARYLQKAYVTQEQYDAMTDDDKNDNTLYVIRED